MTEKLILTACICGAEVTKAHNPAVPYTCAEIAREAKSACDAGAAIIHLHVREDDGTPTQSTERFRECMDAIRSVCPDVIIQPSTGGAVGMSSDERLQPLELGPEIASLDCGTCNFGGDEIFVNTESMIIEFGDRMISKNIKPECEVFDKGMIDMAVRLSKKGHIKTPLHFNFVMGVNGGISGTPRDLLFMAESIPADATWTVSGIGSCEFPMATMAILLGGHVRVGFEDNIYLKKGVLAKSNGELVEKAARIARELNREIADPCEARKILSLV
ncbi:MAG: 3-keto-5-aminohexanoate cleavage protein [Clostridiales Family XIII bacterium]|jgi:3-keto-5-aminohexanoate cleavage enzyme|nr:3-keto-5-aminohexanoate cleavage protein [Clostridiales Family XIII bacterium]